MKLLLKVAEMKIHITELAYSIDPDEVAQYEPPHLAQLDQYFLPSVVFDFLVCYSSDDFFF